MLSEAGTDASIVRIAVTRIFATDPISSGAAAIANVFNPGPLGVRIPGNTGGLAAEAELLAIDGRQAAAVAFARSANVVGMDTPSLSRVGDPSSSRRCLEIRSATALLLSIVRFGPFPNLIPALGSVREISLSAF